MNITEMTVTFGVPSYAIKLLKIMRTQNEHVYLEINEEEEKITLGGEMYEFYDYMDDEDDKSFFEDDVLEVRK